MKKLHSFYYYLPAFEASVNDFWAAIGQPDYDDEAYCQMDDFADFLRQNYRNRYLLYGMNNVRNNNHLG